MQSIIRMRGLVLCASEPRLVCQNSCRHVIYDPKYYIGINNPTGNAGRSADPWSA